MGVTHVGWKSVSPERYLWQRGATFYVRRRVPKALRVEIGREFLIAALKTSDRKEAVRLATYVNQQHQARLDEAAGRQQPEANTRKLDEVPMEEIEAMVNRWFADGYRAAAAVFASEPLAPDDELRTDDPAERKRHLKARQGLLMLTSHPRHEEILRPAINHLITANGLAHRFKKAGGITIKSHLEVVADRAGWKYRIFIDLTRRASIELFAQEIAQLSDAAMVISDPDLREIVQAPSKPRRRTTTLGQLIEEFKGDPRRGVIRKKVELDYGLMFRVLEEVIGLQRRVRDISRDDCKAVRDLLVRLPTNATKLYRDLTFAEACEKGRDDKRPVLSPTTVNSYLVKMSTLFKFAVDEERLDRNPARSLTIAGHEHSEDDRHPFSEAQLTKIFSAPVFLGCENDGRGWANPGPNRPKGTKFWIPLIALFHGMRLNEICQLRIRDAYAVDGIHVFHIRADDTDKRIKTVSANRRVPIHSALLDAGFLTYRDSLKSAGHERLFPDLKKDIRGYYSDGFQKWFSRLIERQKAVSEKTSFHSFRHTWRDAIRDAAVPQERVRLIGGWKRTETDERYGSGLTLAIVQADIEKVAFPKINALVFEAAVQQVASSPL